MSLLDSPLRTVVTVGIGVAAFMGAFRSMPGTSPRTSVPPLATPVLVDEPPSLRVRAGEDPISMLDALTREAGIEERFFRREAADGTTALESLPPAPLKTRPLRVIVAPLPAESADDLIEFRRRTRQAMHRALFSGGWEIDGSDALRVGGIRAPDGGGARLFLWELARRTEAGEAQTAVVAWVRWEDLGKSALESVRRIGALFREADGEEDWLCLLGPPYSDMLVTLAAEAKDGKPQGLQPVRLISPWATVDPVEILRQAGAPAPEPPEADEDDDANKRDPLHQHFASAGVDWTPVVGSDAVLVDLLRAELAARVSPQHRERNATIATHPIRLMLIFEGSTSYGRFWGDENLWNEQAASPASRQLDTWGAELAPFQVVSRFAFERGLDGGVATQAGSGPGFAEPLGTVQLDYLLRMFEDIERMQRVYPSEQEPHAIGVFATDVYDKLLLIRLLSRAFPRALLFTTDFDERLTTPAELPFTRNLIVASQYGPGGAPSPEPEPEPETETETGTGTKPKVSDLTEFWRWRDWVQESTFTAARVALDAAAVAPAAMERLRLYEIGNRGMVPLAFRDGGETRSDFVKVDRKAGLELISFCGAALIAAIWIMGLVLWRSLTHPAPIPGVRPLAPSLALLGIAAGSTAIALFARGAIHASANEPFQEPVSMFDGVSVWTTVLARMVAIPLLLYGVFVAWRNAHLGRMNVSHFRLGAFAAACAIGFLAYLLWVQSFGGMGVAPARGTIAREWMRASNYASVLLMIFLVAYAGAMAVVARGRLREFRLRWSRDLCRMPPGWSKGFGEELDAQGRMAARVTAVTWIPATGFALVFLARWRAMDDFHWSFWVVVSILIPLTALVATLALIRIEATLVRRKLLEALQLRACAHPRAKDEPDDVGRAKEFLTSYRRGPFGAIGEDPLVLALLIPLTALGSGGWVDSLRGFGG